jgi:mevalonate-3-phosphate-5-kinase
MGIEKKARIIFIGGIPGVGKSSISGYIASRLCIDIVLSGDYLREFARPLIHGDEGRILNVSVYDAWKQFGEFSRENVLKGFIEQGQIVNRGVEAVLRRAINNGESLILETLYFIPEQIDPAVLKDVIAFYIQISDPSVNAERLLHRTDFTHFRSSGERLAEQLPVYGIMRDYSVEQCRKNSIKVFDNLDYIKTREDILRYCGGDADGRP